MKEETIRIIALLFCTIGALGFSSYFLYVNTILVTTGEQVQAEVVDLVRDSEGLITPKYKFEVAGQTYIDTASIKSNRTSYRIGDPIEVYYDPNNPSVSAVNSIWRMWLFPGLFFVLGLLCVYGTHWMYRDMRLRKKIISTGQSTVTDDWTISSSDKKGRYFKLIAGFTHNGTRYATREIPLTAKESVLLDDGQEITVKYLPENPDQSVVDLNVTLQRN